MIQFVKVRNGVKVYGEVMQVGFNTRGISRFGTIKYNDIQEKYFFYPNYGMLCFEAADLEAIGAYVDKMNKELKK